MKEASKVLDQKVAGGLDPRAALNQIDAEGGVLVEPTPGFVIKSEDVESGQKIFINVCSNDFVEKPHEKSIADNSEEVGIRVPLSVGLGEEDFDKKNVPCVTYDVVLNPESITAGEDDPNFKHMVVQLAMGAISQKYSIGLNPKYRLPKMKYKGGNGINTRHQRLKVKKDSQIEEVASKTKDIDEDSKVAHDFTIIYEEEGNDFSFDGLTLPCYSEEATLQANLQTKVFRQESTEVNIVQTLEKCTCVITVEMPDAKSMQSILLEISDECAKVSSTGLRGDTLMLWFPTEFCSRLAVAEWKEEIKQLILRIPCSPYLAARPEEDPSVFENRLADLAF